jgi:hypothetical protein
VEAKVLAAQNTFFKEDAAAMKVVGDLDQRLGRHATNSRASRAVRRAVY